VASRPPPFYTAGMTDFVSVYVTAGSRDEAEKIARALVEEKLAACVNILPGVKSTYRWQGKIETTDEIVLIAKSRAALFPKLEKRVKELHSYECPCIVAWPVEAGHRPYLDWLTEETKDTKKQ
jgi:periplasmic divalent cation tolerance protein